ncbi:hypothetical protein C5Y97_29265 [Blastopirellula marina]|uniref:Uncharacterized protein n=1 Tax=Blastopirellula marina TaxID=124 RepID=A0A2S8F3Y3_9BACT|nr:hypothetical protein C5Y98_29250 [Blastopirellula marina]PTL41067.1 hypothetical protein C5Y97_29265 [Blastopirellula marina]
MRSDLPAIRFSRAAYWFTNSTGPDRSFFLRSARSDLIANLRRALAASDATSDRTGPLSFFYRDSPQTARWQVREVGRNAQTGPVRVCGRSKIGVAALSQSQGREENSTCWAIDQTPALLR